MSVMKKTKRKRWQDYRNPLIGIGILACVVGMLLFSGVVIEKISSDEMDLGPDVNCAVDVQFYGYYEGERVAIPVMLAPWKISSTVVDALGVDVTWTASGENVDWATLQVWGSLKLYILDYYGVVREEITSNTGLNLVITSTGINAMTGSLSYVLPLIDLLDAVSRSGVTNEGVDYWSVKGVITLSGSVTDDYGFLQEDTTGELSATWSIYDAAGALSLDGSIS